MELSPLGRTDRSRQHLLSSFFFYSLLPIVSLGNNSFGRHLVCNEKWLLCTTHILQNCATNNLSDKMHSWVLSHFVLLPLPRVSVSPFLTLCFPAPVTFSLPRFTHNLCFLFWYRAFYHYFALGIIAAGVMNGGYASAAGGTSRRWMHNYIDCVIADVTAISECSAAPDDLTIAVSLTPPSTSSVQLHLSTSCPVISDAVCSLRAGSKLAIGFQKAILTFFLSFPFLSSTSKSTLPLTSGLLLCLTASLPHVKLSASALQGTDAYYSGYRLAI